MTSPTDIPVDTADFMTAEEPFALFAHWFNEAAQNEAHDPNAMSLATVDTDGMPNVRVVLMKGYDENGFVFYTNLQSQRGQELIATPKAALNFHWKSLKRQVRLRGPVASVSDAEANDYYVSRPLGSRIGAWASQQSRPLPTRDALKVAVEKLTEELGDSPSRPPHWSGFRLSPVSIEFWHDRPYRLHDRLRFDRESASHDWARTHLYP